MATLDVAIHIAAKHHLGQFDKGGNPYILHPLKVMHYTRSEDPEVQMIAILHDIVEDTEVTLEYLEHLGFSSRVVDGIDAMTKRKGEEYNDYIRRVSSNFDAIIVKMADLRHNTDIRRLKGITEKDHARMKRYQETYEKLKMIRAMMVAKISAQGVQQ